MASAGMAASRPDAAAPGSGESEALLQGVLRSLSRRLGPAEAGAASDTYRRRFEAVEAAYNGVQREVHALTTFGFATEVLRRPGPQLQLWQTV